MPGLPRGVRPALAVSSGLLLTLSQEPFRLALLGWIALAPLFIAVARARKPRHAAVYGLLAGASYFSSHLWWIFLFGWMAWTSLSLAMSLYVAAAAVLARVFRRFPIAPVLWASSWVALELLRDAWPFGGYAWGALGASQGPTPGVRWLAGVVGVYGLSFLCALVAALVADRVLVGAVSWGSLALVGSVLLVFVAADRAAYSGSVEGRPARLVVVQGNVPRPERTDQENRVFENHVRLTEQLDRALKPDVVVWPESAIGFLDADDTLPTVSALAFELGAPLLVGRTTADLQRGSFSNAVELVSWQGTVGRYEKRHPVPFGEYVPIPWLRRHVGTLGQVALDMQRGQRATVFDVSGLKIATPICFESAFPRDVRAFARAGAELVVVSTNDASFERSPASMQHLAHSRMRAVELRQWVVQAAISGVSAVVSPSGEVSDRTQLFEPAVVTADVRARPARSLYAKVGDLFSYGFAAGMLVALVLYELVSHWNLVRSRRRTGSTGASTILERGRVA